MQIIGAIDFFSNIASRNLPVGAQNSGFSLTQAAAGRMRADGDFLSLSDTGRELSLNARNESALVEVEEEENQKDEVVDPVPDLEFLDDEMSKMKGILEQMHELAIAAQEEDLEDIDRVNMQIELEGLRSNLAVIPKSMLSQEQTEVFAPVELNVLGHYSDWIIGSSVLGRMKSRIMSGFLWNIREAMSGLHWDMVDDENVLTKRGYETLDTGVKVPTVLDRLEKETPIILMDADSAAEGAKNLERRIDSVQKWRDSIKELRISQESQSADDAEKSSKDMLNQAVNYFGRDSLYSASSLISPDAPKYFVYIDGIYDSRIRGKIGRGDIRAGEVDPAFGLQRSMEYQGKRISRAEAERQVTEYAAKKEKWISNNMAKYDGMKVVLNNKEILTHNRTYIELESVYTLPLLGEYFNQNSLRL